MSSNKILYYYTTSCLIEGKTYFHLDVSELRYGEKPKNELRKFNTFKELEDFFLSDPLKKYFRPYFFLDKTPILKKPRILIFTYKTYRITEKNFRPITLKINYKENKYPQTFHALSKSLNTLEFIEYCVDNGLSEEFIKYLNVQTKGK